MLKRWGSQVRRHPVLGAVGVAVVWQAVIVVVAKVLPPLEPGWFPQLGPTVVNLAGAAVVLVLLRAWGLLATGGVTGLGVMARWPVLLPLVVVAGLAALPGIEGGTATLVGGVVLMLAIGVSEELSSRALVLEVARPLGPVRAVVLTAVLFGVGHLGNWLFFGAPLGNTLWQVLEAGAFGFCLCGARPYIGSVWPLVLVHALSDYLEIYSPGKTADWLQALGLAVDLGLGIGLLLLLRARTAPAPAAS
ncbi:CPBP family intramembrane glutamic endopeptidase [Kitasatospora xanthocidica]|uniref:CPBP family intramembrane glutamic endopeptidase n=1 Tax=Kitasatospora xanthocidica TaxID=83382 RepID=UPI0011C3984D|nr:CPBP family intramembrane glutamic endopeptidase [Kitasatospora xanthocidica]